MVSSHALLAPAAYRHCCLIIDIPLCSWGRQHYILALLDDELCIRHLVLCDDELCVTRHLVLCAACRPARCLSLQNIPTFLKSFSGEVDVSEALEPIDSFKCFNEVHHKHATLRVALLQSLDSMCRKDTIAQQLCIRTRAGGHAAGNPEPLTRFYFTGR